MASSDTNPRQRAGRLQLAETLAFLKRFEDRVVAEPGAALLAAVTRYDGHEVYTDAYFHNTSAAGLVSLVDVLLTHARTHLDPATELAIGLAATQRVLGQLFAPGKIVQHGRRG